MDPRPLAVAAAVPLVAAGLARLGRRGAAVDRGIRRGLAALLAANELGWYAFVVAHGWVDPPFGLPLDLCDLLLWAAVAALVFEARRLREVLYYLALVGTAMAVLTPDLGPETTAYTAARFFLTHGGIVVAVLYLVFTGALRPGPGSWWRALLWVNVYAAAIGAFDAAFGTNYFYLRAKPAAGSLLDLFGPWPVYLAVADAFAAVLFFALSWPFRAGGDPARLRAHSRASREPSSPSKARVEPGPHDRTGGTP